MAQSNEKVITFGDLRNSGAGEEIKFVAFGGNQTLTDAEKSTAKGNVGLANVENKTSEQIRGEITSANVTNALGFTPANTNHNHDGRYYTESEVDSKLAGKSNTGHNHDDRYYTESEVDGKFSAVNAKLGNCTSANTAADKEFVNSSIATHTATFRGTSPTGLTETQFLTWANGLTKDVNDYVFWNTKDENNNPQFKRYKYNGSTWIYEYTLNNSSFTAAQWNAINSTITSGKVAQYDAYSTNKSDVGHTHSQYSLTSHTHPYSAITGTPTIGNGTIAIKSGTTSFGSFTVNQTGNTDINIAHSHPQYSQTGHNHDDRYYTESEVNSLLAGKSDTGHKHDDRYSLSSHTHSQYSLTSHTHSQYSQTGHNHDDRYYTETEVNNLLSGKSNTGHTHTKSQITDFAHNHDERYSLSSHTHDDRYYTESEVNSLLAGKSNTGHTHDDRYYTESEVNSLLAGKANTSGTYSGLNVGYATSAGNADTVDSLHIHTGRNSEANKLVRTDGNGYLQCGYINSSSGDENNNSNPDRVWGTNGSDSYLRTYRTSALSVGYAASAGQAAQLSTARTIWGQSFNGTGNVGGDLSLGDGTTSIYFRTNASYISGIYHSTPGNEAVVFGAINPVSWMFANTNPTNKTEWTSITPSMHIKNQRVAINKQIASGTDCAYNLDVNGTANATTYTVAGAATIQYDSTNECIKFVFN